MAVAVLPEQSLELLKITMSGGNGLTDLFSEGGMKVHVAIRKSFMSGGTTCWIYGGVKKGM